MITLMVKGLNCASCAAKIQSQISNLDDVKKANINLAIEKLEIIPKANRDYQCIIDTASQIINNLEPHVKVYVSNNKIKSNNAFNKTPIKKTFVQQLTSILYANYNTLIGAIILFIMIFFKTNNIVTFIFYVTAYLLIGGDIAYRALKNIFKGALFDENFLMTLATIGAFALGEFTEAVAVMLFYKIGEGFQDYAVDHSRKSIKSLLNIKAEYANLIQNNSTNKVPPEQLNINDLIIIKAGEKVPVDCLVVKGSSTIDASALTGESMPQTVLKDDLLLSGMINIDAPVTAKVSKTYSNSTVAKILEMVENATGKKAKTEQFITKFAKVYTPIVVILAILLAFMPPLLGFGAFREWLSRSLIFLVISCPCALVLSVPLGFFGGLGAASRKGILIKGGNYLEALNHIDAYVFDKTGTLTKGNFAVQGYTNDEALKLAASIEIHSSHPIAHSIVNTYGQFISVDAVINVKEIAGQGLIGYFKGKKLIVGNEKLMFVNNITYTKSNFSGTIIYVAYNNKFIGEITIADEIKDSAFILSNKLHHLRAKDIVMLTGDQKGIALDVAKQLGISKVFSELLPIDKLEHIEAFISKGRKVLFVGDGINDAPVLARADIGVAMGGIGSDAAIEAADIILMTDEPSKLLEAKQIAKKTRKIVMENIIFALSIKLFFLSLGAIGIASMYEAIFADVGVALLAVLNSMRVMKA